MEMLENDVLLNDLGGLVTDIVDNEVWKDIKDYEGLYQVSNMGNVRSMDRTTIGKHGKIMYFKGKNISPTDNGFGYYIVNLRKNGICKVFLVHRLVAMTFIKNNNPLLNIVNHKDENKTNNNVENLEWCTQKYNANYMNALKNKADTYKENQSKGLHKKNRVRKTVIITNISTGEELEFDNLSMAGKFIGVSRAATSKTINGGMDSVRGWKIRYKEEESV